MPAKKPEPEKPDPDALRVKSQDLVLEALPHLETAARLLREANGYESDARGGEEEDSPNEGRRHKINHATDLADRAHRAIRDDLLHEDKA